MNYQDEWKLFSEANMPTLNKEDIATLISSQSRQTTSQLNRYLWFDLALKIFTLLGLLLAIILIMPNLHAYPLIVVSVVGMALAYYQYYIIKSQPNYDYSESTLVVLSHVLIKTRLRINQISLIVSTTNPLIILAGAYLYLYFKYGQSLDRSSEDIAVTLGLMTLGFMISFVTFNIQQNSVLNDLEISNHVLVNEDDSGLKKIARRRRRRFVLTVLLMVTGFILFLLLLSGYLIIV